MTAAPPILHRVASAIQAGARTVPQLADLLGLQPSTVGEAVAELSDAGYLDTLRNGRLVPTSLGSLAADRWASEAIEHRRARLMAQATTCEGATWGDVGRALGTSRQAARQLAARNGAAPSRAG